LWTISPPAPNDTNQSSEINSSVPNIIIDNIAAENSEKIIANVAPAAIIETNETPSNDPMIEPGNETIINDTSNDTENSAEEEEIPPADIRNSNDFD